MCLACEEEALYFAYLEERRKAKAAAKGGAARQRSTFTADPVDAPTTDTPARSGPAAAAKQS